MEYRRNAICMAARCALERAPEMSKLLAQNEERCPIPFSKKISIKKI
jgi:hypothetical protein